jgi:hypothetical protein
LSDIYNEKKLLGLLTKMLKYTTPHPFDVAMQVFMPKGGRYDDKGNYILTIGESKTLFACHVDTVGKEIEDTELYIEDGWIKVKSGKSCLGGDDKCGVLILLALINSKIPGTYIFHVGEERGCIGAKFLLESGFDFTKFDRAIEFDRKDKHSVIYGMSGARRTCSDKFVEALAAQLGDALAFKGDGGGSYTDVATYMKIIPEVTNLSCGYFNEHSSNEKIDAKWLVSEYIPQLLKVDWESLPTERNASVDESVYKSTYASNNNYHHGHHGYHDYEDCYESPYSSHSNGNYKCSGNRCDFCDSYKYPFHAVMIAGVGFTLCDDCTSKFYNCWDDGIDNDELQEFGWKPEDITFSEEEEEEEEKGGNTITSIITDNTKK